MPIAEALAAAAPENTKAQGGLASVHSALGNTLWAAVQLGRVGADRAPRELSAAGEHYEEALQIVERLATAEPDNAEWQDQLATAYRDAGGFDIAAATGDWERARRRLGRAVEIYGRLAAADPENDYRQWDLLTAHNQAGQVAVAQGDAGAARESFKQALEIVERLVDKGPGPNGVFIAHQWEMHWRLAQLLAASEPEAAAHHAQRAKELWARVEELGAAQPVEPVDAEPSRDRGSAPVPRSKNEDVTAPTTERRKPWHRAPTRASDWRDSSPSSPSRAACSRTTWPPPRS